MRRRGTWKVSFSLSIGHSEADILQSLNHPWASMSCYIAASNPSSYHGRQVRAHLSWLVCSKLRDSITKTRHWQG